MSLGMRMQNRGGTFVVVLVLIALVVAGVVGFWFGRHGGEGAREAGLAATVTPADAPAESSWLKPIPPTNAVGSETTVAEAEPSGSNAAVVMATGDSAVVVSAPAATNPATAKMDSPAAPSATEATPTPAQAEALLTSGKRVEARDAFLAIVQAPGTDERTRTAVEARLATLNVELVRQPWPIPEKIDYVVQAGDSIRAIAQKYGTTVDLIVEGGKLARPDHIEPGDRLRVFTGKLALVANTKRNDLLVTCNGRFFKRYRIGTGKYGKTPVGTFVVSDRIKDPPWWRGDGKVIPFGDKENILGTRWMALKATGSTPEVKGYGIHGTWENDSIGKAESAGCIRLRNEDVEELFQMVPVGTPVTIEE